STPTGKLTLTMLAGVAEFEKSQILERTANGKKARAKTSEYANGGAPKFGCKAENKKLVMNESEQEIIDIIRKHHKSGKSPQKIADYLNKNNLPSKRGGTWSKTTVGRVLEG
ncbi:MAG: recombinase family protein, partial [Sphaerospermopsis kisseleviana]